MKKFFVLGIIISFSALIGCSSSKKIAQSGSIESVYYTSGSDTISLKGTRHFILLSDNRVAIATDESVSILKESKLLGEYPINNTTAFLRSDDTLFIASARGLYALTLSSGELRKRSLPARDPLPKISSLAIDQRKTLWVGTEGFGVFSLSGEKVRPYSLAPYITSMAVTRDSSVWAGSNVGVFRIFSGGEIKRYYEEIPANGIAIPDNIIEHMNVDNSGHIWIFMSQAVSVLTPDDYEKYHTVSGDGDVDPHTFAFLGSPNNHIQKFIQHKKKANVWWAISTEGLFVISDVEFESALTPGIPDKIEAPKADLRKVSAFHDARSQKRFEVTDPTDLSFDDNGNLWISGSEGLVRIGSEILSRFEGEGKAPATSAK